MTDTAIIQRLERLEQQNRRILKILTEKKEPAHWVKAYDVIRLTGWTRETLRQRRVQGMIRFKKEGTHWKYDMASVSPYLILTTHENNQSNPRDAKLDDSSPVAEQTLKS